MSIFRISKAVTQRGKEIEKILINYIICQLEKERLINTDDKEIVAFGLRQGLDIFFITGLILFFGGVMGQFIEGILLLLFFVPLRIYAGGYHADSKFVCVIVTVGGAIFSLWCIENIDIPKVGLNILCFICFCIIFKCAPMGNGKKSLDIIERNVYCRKVRILLCMEYIIFQITLYINISLEKVIFISFVLVSILLLTEFLKKFFMEGAEEAEEA